MVSLQFLSIITKRRIKVKAECYYFEAFSMSILHFLERILLLFRQKVKIAVSQKVNIKK